MKTKGYIFSIILLTVILVGIAYVRALYSSQSRQGDAIPTIIVTDSISADDYVKRDDLGSLIDSVRLYYIDSLYTALARVDSTGETRDNPPLDSMITANDELSQLILELQAEVELAKENNNKDYKKLIYRFYSGEMADLPADLTKYEKDVSTSEIKTKTNKYFNLKAGALDRIIADHK